MRNAGGYAVWVAVDGSREVDSFTCSHCQRVVFVPPRADPSQLGGFCRQCMKHICAPCVKVGGCKPWEKQMAEAEARDRMLRAIGV